MEMKIEREGGVKSEREVGESGKKSEREVQLTVTGSGDSRSSSEGLGGVARDADVLVCEALDGASESLHCSTSTSTSSLSSGNRSTEIGPVKRKKGKIDEPSPLLTLLPKGNY